VTAALNYLLPIVGIAAACRALGVARASYYRAQRPPKEARPRPRPHRALSESETAATLEALNSDRFVDQPPRQVYAALLDEGTYLCSVPTMYRILRRQNQLGDRRRQCRHGTYARPELVAEAPNQVWSWDITKLPGPTKGTYFSLYAAIDIYSRYVVGWAISRSESATVAGAFLSDAYHRHGLVPDRLVCHSDRGGPMTARSTAMLYADLGIIASYSRPRVSNDNPYSEAAFKTFKYRPEMPDRFYSIEEARAFFAELFDWYNERHYHTGIALLTPSDVHHGRATEIVAVRQVALDKAFARTPERFVRRPPRHALPSAAVWINPPESGIVA